MINAKETKAPSKKAAALSTSAPALLTLLFAASLFSLPAHSQTLSTTAAGTNRLLELAEGSPFFDPNIIYLEADELINDETTGILTAQGEVEGRYQDRTLRADQVLYTLETGRVIASGNVVLIDATGATQYADKLELSDTLEAGTASNFSARFPEGGILSSKIVVRDEREGVALYNAFYTACEACDKDGKTKTPTWRIRARKVTQEQDKNYIQYRDAVVEFKGIPLIYTPYLAHPDPSADRASGWLNPFIGIDGARGFNVRTPYYYALDDHSELTITPQISARVNPLLEADYRRLFHRGEINVNASLTYASPFDNDGDAFNDPSLFTNPEDTTLGRQFRSHFFADGLFDLDDVWQLGFGIQTASDDLFLKRNDLDESPDEFGLHDAASRRLVSQAFIVGQDDNFRFSTSAYGFQSLRTSIIEDDNTGLFTVFREEEDVLPIVAPKIEFEHYLTDPLIGGRLKTFADTTILTRELGTDYLRATGGLDWSKNFIAPGGVEVKPFANGRFDYFDIEPEDLASESFERTLGQAGVDVRWPFIKATETADFIIEPRVQVTQSFGDGNLENFTRIDGTGQAISLFQDSLDIDLDQALFWSSNKSTGFDFWQEGFRADLGASFIANWDEDKRAHLFVGQSYASGFDDSFLIGSGLAGNSSDIIGLFELDLGPNFSSSTRVRFDDNDNNFSRIDTDLKYSNRFFTADARYFRFDESAALFTTEPNAPSEELSGGITLRLANNWSTAYRASRDLDLDITRRQSLSLIYDDECTRVELIYHRNRNDLGLVGSNSGLGIRLSLLTLGDFGDQ